MPIQQKDLGKYNRPDIFIEEINQSIIELPVQDILINLVPGFSKKGPINKPVYVDNPTTFANIFGSLDRQLENKSSYFHRTCLKMLQSGPIWALNLLSTNDTRDLVEYDSISTASFYDNYPDSQDTVSTIPYSKIFNRQDFWKRDDIAFQDYLKSLTTWSSDRLLNITNLNNKMSTVFMFKSDVTGFDVTAEWWYGGINKVPSYLNPTDWISDFMVKVIVIEGNWTDYNSLSVDTTWSNYFDNTGLLKDKVTDFLNENNVTTLAYYDTSLIPYFRDLGGRDLYIKSNINADTDISGIFCSYNEDILMSADYPNGKLDIIGDGLVGRELTSVNFMSYNQSLTETVSITNKFLDASANVFANHNSDLTSTWNATYASRTTGEYTNWYVHDTTVGENVFANLHIIDADLTGSTLVCSEQVTGITDFDGSTITFNKSFGGVETGVEYTVEYPAPTSGAYNFAILDPSGSRVSGITLGTVTNIIATVNKMAFTLTSDSYFVTGTKQLLDSSITSIDLEPLTLTYTGETMKRVDVVYLLKDSDTVLTYEGSEGSVFDNPTFENEDAIVLGYLQLEFSAMTSSVNYIPVTLSASTYQTLELDIIGDVVNNTLTITFPNATGSSYDSIRELQYHDELSSILVNNKSVIVNSGTGYKHQIESDYIITDDPYTITITNIPNPTEYYNGSEMIIYYMDDEFILPDTINTDRMITIDAPVETLSTSGITGVNAAGVVAKWSTFYQNYYSGDITNNDYFLDANNTSNRIYLKMWIDTLDNLTLDFVANETSGDPDPIYNWLSIYGYSLSIVSDIGNFKQTVEIESFDTSNYPNNVNTIKVDRTRYAELKKGDMLESNIPTIDPNDTDATYNESTGMYSNGRIPKKLTRITKVYIDSSNSALKIVETDAPIKITDNDEFPLITGSTDWMTTQYSPIDEYVSTYKGINIKPFKISNLSIPDGTDGRQNSILSVLDKTTNLAKALVNKNKITWRYLIDSFGLGLIPETDTDTDIITKPKQQLVDICGEKLNCLGFINMPSVRDFKNSVSPNFMEVNESGVQTGAVSTEFIMKGGNEDLNPTYLYEFADGNGQSCVGYFFPYLRISDNGVPKYIPPASYAATTYMQKFTGAPGLRPWTIMAGTTNGRINGIGGTEIDFSNDDLANLHQMGANPITYKRSAGYCINSENTAQVFPYSSLSVIHSREVLIELENQLYDMLLRYQWRFNTAEIRAEIRFRADEICKSMQDGDALYAYENVMNTVNNTNYIIDLQMGVLDTYIEIIKGMGVIINNITILKKGDIESGGFL